MNRPDDGDMIGQHTIDVHKGEDGMYTASARGADVPPMRAKTERDAVNAMTTALDKAIKTHQTKGL